MGMGNLSVGCCNCGGGGATVLLRVEYLCPGCSTNCRRNLPSGDVVTVTDGTTSVTGTVGAGGVFAIPAGFLPAPSGATHNLASNYRATVTDTGITAGSYVISALAPGSASYDYSILMSAKLGQTAAGKLCGP